MAAGITAFELDLDRDLACVVAIEGFEGIQVGFAVLLGSTAKDDLGAEYHIDTGDVHAGQLDRIHKILPGVAFQPIGRDLRSRENHRFADASQGEGQGAGGVTHGIRAMRNHEAIIFSVIFGYGFDQPIPMGGSHVGAVDVVDEDGIQIK